MIRKIVTKLRQRPVDPNQYEVIGRPAGRLAIAAASGSGHVHLAADDDSGRPAWSLCAQRVSRQQPTNLFSDSGCWVCASIALSTGHNVAEEKDGRRVNLREWLANGQSPAVEHSVIERRLAP